jgi:hypothetical protein
MLNRASFSRTSLHGCAGVKQSWDRIRGENSVLTRLRAMYGTRNLEWRAAAFLIVSRPGRQAMVDLGLVPQCPPNSMTSAAAMHGLVAVRPCKRPGPTPLESL